MDRRPRQPVWVYGAAGSLIVILVWVYYSSQILLFGAEMTQVYASKSGSRRKRWATAAPDRLTAV